MALQLINYNEIVVIRENILNEVTADQLVYSLGGRTFICKETGMLLIRLVSGCKFHIFGLAQGVPGKTPIF